MSEAEERKHYETHRLRLMRTQVVESPESLGTRIEAASEAQKRSRVVVLAATIISLMMIVSSYNSYISISKSLVADVVQLPAGASPQQAAPIPNPAKDPNIDLTNRAIQTTSSSGTSGRAINLTNPQDILTRKTIESWVESRNVSISLIGLRVAVDDAPIIGTLALLVVASWLLLAIRRENHTIGFLLRDTAFPTVETAGQNYKTVDYSDTRHLSIKWRVFHAIVSNLVFTPFRTSLQPLDGLRTPNPTAPAAGSGREDPASPFSTGFFLATKIVIIYLPFVAATLVYLLAICSAYQHSLFRPDQSRPIDSPAVKSMILVMTAAFVLLGGPLLAVCVKSWAFERNTGKMIREYYDELKLAIDRVALHPVVIAPAAASSISATSGNGVDGTFDSTLQPPPIPG